MLMKYRVDWFRFHWRSTYGLCQKKNNLPQQSNMLTVEPKKSVLKVCTQRCSFLVILWCMLYASRSNNPWHFIHLMVDFIKEYRPTDCSGIDWYMYLSITEDSTFCKKLAYIIREYNLVLFLLWDWSRVSFEMHCYWQIEFGVSSLFLF